jgi:hypothetical protein
MDSNAELPKQERKSSYSLMASTNSSKSSNTALGSYPDSRKSTMRSNSQAPQVTRVNIRDMMEQIMTIADKKEQSKTKSVRKLLESTNLT